MARENPPQRELNDLASALEAAAGKSQALALGYVLRGPERYFREQALSQLRRAAVQAGHEIVEHDAAAATFSLQNACDDLRGGGLFASRRCLILRAAQEILVKRDGEESAVMRALKTFVASQQGPLVLEGEGLRADNASVKWLVQQGAHSFSFRRLYDQPAPWDRDQDPRSAELVVWLLSRARARKLALTPAQALLLCSARGNDPAALDDELEQLHMGKASGLTALSADAAGAPFRLAEALLDGQLAQALKENEQYWRGGMQKEGGGRETSEGALTAVLLAGLRRGVRQALALSERLERGAEFDDACTELGVSSFPAARAQLRRQLQAFTSAQWRRRLEDLARLECDAKSSGGIDANRIANLALAWSAAQAPRGAARKVGSGR